MPNVLKKFEEKRKEIERRIEKAKEYKKEVVDIASKLLSQYKDEEITKEEYNEKLKGAFKEKSAQEWLDYYDHYISNCKNLLEKCDKDIRQRTIKLSFKQIFPFFLTWILAIIVLVLFYITFIAERPIFLAPSSIISNQTLDLVTNSSLDYEWTLRNEGKLNFVKIYGSIEGEGKVNVFLGGEERKWLILDSTDLEENNTVTKEFSNYCEETCDLSAFNLNETSYTLKIEIEGSARLKIDTITYEILAKEIEEIPEGEANIISDELIQDKAEINLPVKWERNIKLDKAVRGFSLSLPESFDHKAKDKTGKELSFNILDNKITIQNEVDEIKLEYLTPEPRVTENIFNRYRKQIAVYSDVHYENILVYTSIDEFPEKRIKLYWLINDSRELVENVSYIDNNNNGLIDRLEWIVPSLSNHTFEIVITKAEHLGVNYNFISDIYANVSVLDGNWSEQIYHNEYARVTFEQNLTSNDDISVYVRNTQGFSTTIEVYHFNSTTKIADFPAITGEEYYKVELTGMNGSHDTFDLRIKHSGNNPNAFLEFDHIVDPLAFPGGAIELRAQACSKQIEQISQNVFESPCAGNYPEACGDTGDRLSCDDGSVESSSTQKEGSSKKYGGVNITAFNSSITNCQSIDQVFLCYDFGGFISTQHTCNVGVDADGGASWTNIAATCVQGVNLVTCINVTAYESWTCNNFFGVSGTRALAKAQAQKTAGSGSVTWLFDVLYFNVSYTETIDTTPPIVTINKPEFPGINYSMSNVNFNVTLNEDGSACLYSLNSGMTNTTMQKNGNRDFNATNSSIVDGQYTVKYYCNDTAGNLNATASRSFGIDTIFPLISYGFGTADDGANLTQNFIYVNVTWTETNFKNITFLLRNDTIIINSTTYTTPNYTINWTNLAPGNYTYNVSIYDSAGNFNSTPTRIINLSAANTPPQIIFVSSIGIVQPRSGNFTSVQFNFTAFDQNGEETLNDNSASARFNFTGEALRENLTCVPIVGESTLTTKNYSCTIEMWYFDINGDWTINATIQDDNGAKTENSTTTFTYNLLSSFDFSPSGLQWPTIFAGNTDILATEYMLINNTGNDNKTIKIKAFDLLGEDNSAYSIPAANFSAYIENSCNLGTILANNTQIEIQNSILSRGNNSLNFGDENSGQEKLYFCIEQVPSNIVSQTYSSKIGGSWEITILAGAFIARTKKKRKKEFKELAKILNDKDVLEIVGEKLVELLDIVKKSKRKEEKEIPDYAELEMPVGIFKEKIGAAESLCKYLKENKNMKFNEISKVLNRDRRTISTNYKNACKRKKEMIEVEETKEKISIPIKIFSNRKLSILENLVYYLREKGHKNSEISRLIDKDPRNVWTLYSRAKNKNLKL